MRIVPLCLIFAVTACARPHQQPVPFSFALREVAEQAAPLSLAQGMAVSREYTEGASAALASHSGELSLIATELPGFAERFCGELQQYLDVRTAVTRALRSGEGTRTVEHGDGTAETVVEPSHYCAYHVDRGWVVAHLVILLERQQAFMHVSIMRS
jgi:hypothetical protein